MQRAITSLVIFFLLVTNLALSGQTTTNDFLEIGNNHFEQKNYAKSIDYFSTAIRKDPSNAKALYNRSLAFYELEKYNKALTDLNRFLDLYPNDLEASEQRGNLRFLLNDYTGSITDYNKSLRKDPDNVVYVNRACAKLNLHKYMDALEDIEEALALDPNDVEAYINKADIYFETKKYAGALEIYNHALQISPENPRILNNRANCYYEMGKPDLAMADYSKAIEVAAESGSFANRGYLFLDRKQAAEALLDCTEASLNDSGNSDAFNCIGLSRQMSGKTTEAMLNFDKAIALEPRPEYFMNRGKLSLEIGNTADALHDFNMVKRKDQAYPELGSWITKASQALTDSEIATETSEEGDDFLDESPSGNDVKPVENQYKGAKAVFVSHTNNPKEEYFLDKAFELNGKGLYLEALALFNKVIRSNKRIARAYHGRGIAHSHLNNFGEAIRDFTSAIRLDENQIASLYNRGVINFDQGKYELAQRDFARVLKRDTDFGDAATLWQECDLKLLSLR